MITIDGSHGEGGGQILRTSLGLSALTAKPFKIINIRKSRKKPGLEAQHLNAVKAASVLCNAEVEGDELSSIELLFSPRDCLIKDINIKIGTAGSVTLVLQSLLIPIILHKNFCEKEIKITISGGTDVAWSQPIDYFKNVLCFFLKEYADITCDVIRRGYFPKGDGKVVFRITQKKLDQKTQKINLTERGNLIEIRGISHASIELQKARVAERQAESSKMEIAGQIDNIPVTITEEYTDTSCVGSGIVIWAVFENSRIGADELGKKGLKAEEVGREAAKKLLNSINANGVVDEFMGDQLIPFLAVLKGKYSVEKISNHTLSNIFVTEKFLDIKFNILNNLVRID